MKLGYVDLFYSYLLIRENLRGEFVQNNNGVGFANFQTYQRRKLQLINDPIFQNDIVRRAVRENIFNPQKN